MKDVAREANVSVATVSNFLNGKKVRPKAAKDIDLAIKKLNYVRNNTARFLKTQRSAFVVFVVPSVWSPFFSELTFWVQKYLDNLGYKMVLCVSENDYQKEKSYVTMAEEQLVAGILSISYSDLTSHVHSDIPLVSIEKESTGQFSLVSSDNYEGGKIAAKELNERNIDKYIFIGSANHSSVEMNARKAGFIDYCNNHGLKFEIAEVDSQTDDKEKIDSLIDEISNNGKKYGIFAHTDEIALILTQKFRDAGIKIPEQVQIIGFDGWKLTPDTHLTISTIRQNIEEIAKTAVEQLHKEMEDPDHREISRLMIPVTFRAGDTTKNK